MDVEKSAAKVSGTQLRAKLKEAGLRVTIPRLEVLATLVSLGGHHSVDELHDALQQRGLTLPRASVYNVINAFVEMGLVQSADTGPGTVLYELAGTVHHHFICRGCGAIVDVPCQGEDRPCLEATLPGYQVDEAQVIFRGWCPRCRTAESL